MSESDEDAASRQELELFCSTLRRFSKQRPIEVVACGDKKARFLGGHAGTWDQQGCSYIVACVCQECEVKPLTYRDHGGRVFTVEEFCEHSLGNDGGDDDGWRTLIQMPDGKPLDEWLRQESAQRHQDAELLQANNSRTWLYWPGELRWFQGQFSDFDEDTGLCTVTYDDDGSQEVVCLAAELSVSKKQRTAPAVPAPNAGELERFFGPLEQSPQQQQQDQVVGRRLRPPRIVIKQPGGGAAAAEGAWARNDEQLIVAASTLSSLATPLEAPPVMQQQQQRQHQQQQYQQQQLQPQQKQLPQAAVAVAAAEALQTTQVAWMRKRMRTGASAASSRSTMDPKDTTDAPALKSTDPTDASVVMTMNEELMDVTAALEGAGLLSSASGLQFLLRWQSMEPVQRMMLFRTVKRNLSEPNGLHRTAQLIAIMQE